MSNNGMRSNRAVWIVALVTIVLGPAGCPALAPTPSTTGFSQLESVRVADNRIVEAALGAGAPGLADSAWAMHKSEDDTLLFRIGFASDGQVERLFDSFVFGAPWLGTEIIPDTQSHPTEFVGGTYRSGAYAAEDGEHVGVLGVLHGSLLGTHLGTATLSFAGPIDGDRIDGVMIRTVDVFADTPFEAPGNAEFDAYALRER